jgi:DNA modification methylase
LTGKVGHYRHEARAKRADTYATYQDTAENFIEIIVPAIQIALDVAACGLVFMADQSIWHLPPGNIGGIFMPNGCGMGAWGFQTFMHCVFYGRDPYLAAGMGSRPNGKFGLYGNDANAIDHPCAKPVAAMIWAVARASLERQTVLDPFMGSGTTGVACARLGRHFVGVEIEPRYFEIACRRVEEAQRQGDLIRDVYERPAALEPML